jgi:hypothetical protein
MKNGILVACLAEGLIMTAPVLGATPGEAGEAAQDARVAVAGAQAAVERAAEKRTLWTTAQDALRDAQEALARQDYAAAERSARFAADQARLGIEQLEYPPFHAYAPCH